MKILIVEDELPLSEVLVALLQQNSYLVDAVYDGILGYDYAMSGIYDAIILDIMLPGKSGIEILRDIRKSNISTPVLMLTAKSEIEDKIIGLDSGADDYLTKPFDTGELLARLRAMLRRKGELTTDDIICGDTRLNKTKRALSCRDMSVQLGLKEFQIMEMLMENSGQVIPRELIIEKVWGFDSDAEYNATEVYVSFIRKKLAAIQADIQIKAIRGVGYMLEVVG